MDNCTLIILWLYVCGMAPASVIMHSEEYPSIRSWQYIQDTIMVIIWPIVVSMIATLWVVATVWLTIRGKKNE